MAKSYGNKSVEGKQAGKSKTVSKGNATIQKELETPERQKEIRQHWQEVTSLQRREDPKEVKKQYKVALPRINAAKQFDSVFNASKARGEKEFEHKGKKYSTLTADEKARKQTFSQNVKSELKSDKNYNSYAPERSMRITDAYSKQIKKGWEKNKKEEAAETRRKASLTKYTQSRKK
jgi:hypothetical protein